MKSSFFRRMGKFAAHRRGALARTLAESAALGNADSAGVFNERVKGRVALTGNPPPLMCRTVFHAIHAL
jgi:hypothetical protein